MILLLGFPKSGTSSFQELFIQLGYTSYHQTKNEKSIGLMIKENKKNKISLLKDFNKLECITQLDICIDVDNAYWPQLLDYEQLYNENKKAIFILNKRNPEKIMSSFNENNKN
jgi:hypothetical protein